MSAQSIDENATACSGCELSAAKKNAIAEDSEAYRVLQWKYTFVRNRFNQLLDIMERETDAETLGKMIRQLGCECSRSVAFISENIGNLQGYWDELEKRWGEKAEFDEANGIITITTPERPCVCPLIIQQQTPPSICDCSLGWQKQTYETILSRPVEVTLVESALRGSKRCAFKIHIL